MSKTTTAAETTPAVSSLSELTLKERAFVLGLLQHGNQTLAAIDAGYARASAHVRGSELVRKSKIKTAITEVLEAKADQAIADADERDRTLSNIIRNPLVETSLRISAIKELNKCSGRHSMKHQHEGKLTLEQLLGESRQ